MTDIAREKKITFGEARRKLIIQHTEDIIKDKCPMHIEKLLSWIEMGVGIKRENAKSILVILSDTEKLEIDPETNIVYWGKIPQIPREKQENIG